VPIAKYRSGYPAKNHFSPARRNAKQLAAKPGKCATLAVNYFDSPSETKPFSK
jgi:hypothetical protein